jgi:hypothetical protein
VGEHGRAVDVVRDRDGMRARASGGAQPSDRASDWKRHDSMNHCDSAR